MKIILIFLSILMVSCRSTRRDDLANEITFSFAQEMKKEHNLILSGFGGANEQEKIKTINAFFEIYGCLDIEQARNFYIYIAKKFLKKINDNQEIQQYLPEHPASLEMAGVELFFKDKEHKHPPKEYVAGIVSANGNLYYSIWSEHERYKTIYSETYEEALAKARPYMRSDRNHK